jgi:hypothetical protein
MVSPGKCQVSPALAIILGVTIVGVIAVTVAVVCHRMKKSTFMCILCLFRSVKNKFLEFFDL